MGDTTDELLDLAQQVNPAPPEREMDMLLTAGERISNALVAMAISAHGAEAWSFTGSQAGVVTTAVHGNARIIDVTPSRVTEALDQGYIALVTGVPDHAGAAARIFRVIADAEIDIDMVLQNVSSTVSGRTDITFTLSKANGAKAVKELEKIKEEIGFESVLYDDHVGKVSLVGAGMRSHPGVTATFCEALAGVG